MFSEQGGTRNQDFRYLYPAATIITITTLIKCPLCGAGMYGNKSTTRRKDGTAYDPSYYYTMLGVDFESINPSGSGFWLKFFHAYTNGVVRRIDERIMQRASLI